MTWSKLWQHTSLLCKRAVQHPCTTNTLDEGVVKTLKSVFSSFDVFEDEWIDVDNYAC